MYAPAALRPRVQIKFYVCDWQIISLVKIENNDKMLYNSSKGRILKNVI